MRRKAWINNIFYILVNFRFVFINLFFPKSIEKDCSFLRKKNQKRWGVPIRPIPLTGRAWGTVDYRGTVAGCPAPTRFTMVVGANYLATGVRNNKVFYVFLRNSRLGDSGDGSSVSKDRRTVPTVPDDNNPTFSAVLNCLPLFCMRKNRLFRQ
jgi:hypothetical protein